MTNTPEYDRCGNDADDKINMPVVGMMSSMANGGMKSNVTKRQLVHD